MQASDMSFYFLAAPSYYDIPFFQRAYVWKEDNWRELFEDLSSSKRSHFLGSIILKNELVSAGDNSRYFVIDGQQRLTTLSVLLRACYDYIAKKSEKFNLNEEDINKCKLMMESLLFVNEGGLKTSLKPKINHSKLDKDAYDSVISGNLDKDDIWENIINSEDNSDSAICKAYAYFRNELENAEIEQVNNLWDVLTANKIKFLVNINLNQEDDEQAIFDTVNSSGVRLTSADTIKNLIFQRYVEALNISGVSNVSDNAIKKYSETWEKAFLIDNNVDEYWNTMRSYGRMKKSNLEIFLHAFAVILGFFDPSEDYIADLPKKYKKYISELNLSGLDGFLEEMCQYAFVYLDYFTENDDNLSYSNYVGRLLNICNSLELSTFYPYLLQQLYLLKTKSLTEDNIKIKFFGLEKYLILNAICSGTTKNYNKECVQLVTGRTDAKELLEINADINEARFTNGLRNMTSNKLPTLLLFWVELYLRQSDYYSVTDLKYDFTLEHIMPQKWKENWINVPAYDENGKIIETIEEKEIVRRKSIYQIGNMTLLKSKLNSSVSNSSFSEKKSGKNGKLGIDHYSGLLITKEVTNEEEWNDLKIYKRTQLMEDRIREIWDAQELPEETASAINSGTERHIIRYEFWEYALPIVQEINEKKIYSNHMVKATNCVKGSIGIGGFSIDITANFDKARVDFSLYKRDKNSNKKAFDILYSNKDEIETKIGSSLHWSRENELRGSWISIYLSNVSIGNKEDWEKMADFLGQWSKKFREIMIPYLQNDFTIETSNVDPDVQIKRIKSYELIKEWILQNDKIIPCLEKSNRRYIRFMTKNMSEFLPSIEGSKSGWNSENHYFYEILNPNGNRVRVKFVISGYDLNDELREKCRKLNEIADEKKKNEDWLWWTLYSTEGFDLPEDLDKQKVFSVLDSLCDTVLQKEKNLLSKLSN